MKNEKKTIAGIYKITNVINGHAYIGQSTNIKKRWQGHKQNSRNINSRNYNLAIYAAIRKYGLEYFDFTVLEECAVEELSDREIYWIKYYDTYHNGYNQTMGGEGCNIDMPENIAKVIDDLKKSKLSFTEIAQNNGVSISLVSRINSGENWHDDELTYPIRDTSSKRKVCPICGGKKSESSKMCKNCRNKKMSDEKCEKIGTGKCLACGTSVRKTSTYCLSCYKKQQAKNIPSKDALIEDLLILPMVQIGKKYGVSDKAVVKWCKKYNLPSKRKEIEQFRKEYMSEN